MYTTITLLTVLLVIVFALPYIWYYTELYVAKRAKNSKLRSKRWERLRQIAGDSA
ncbi:MAG: hypothetical protein AAGI34_00460 [Pseudomonadota bacterium]